MLTVHAANKAQKQRHKKAGWVHDEAEGVNVSPRSPSKNEQSDMSRSVTASPVRETSPVEVFGSSDAAQGHPNNLESGTSNGAISPSQMGDGRSNVPKTFSDGRVNPYYLLMTEQERTLMIFGCFGFSRYSMIRSKCILILNESAWQTFFVLGAVLNSIYIAWIPSLDPETIDASTQELFEWADFLFLGIFYFEMIVGWIAWGFSGEQTAWFNRDFFHRLDFFIFLVSIYEQLTEWLGVQSFTLRPLRLLRIIKVMTSLRHFASVKAILITLGDGVSQLVSPTRLYLCLNLIVCVCCALKNCSNVFI